MEFRFRKRDPAYLLHFWISLFGGFFFRAKSITDAVLYIKDYLLKVILVRNTLLTNATITNYCWWLFFVVVEWNNRFKKNRFQVKQLVKPLAIATIVALGTYSDYKEFIYFQF
jgi:hypothetical protein